MRYRHIARGTTYVVIDAHQIMLNLISEDGSIHSFFMDGVPVQAELQCSVAKAEGSRYGGRVCLYQCETTAKYYLRPPFEFFDPTRFERLDD